jgi:alkylation response protein AidB-like acyl-CoA dehydrogenase
VDFRFGGENDTFASDVRAFLEREMAGDRVHADSGDLSGLAEPFERALHHAAGERGYLSTTMAATERARFNFLVAAFDAPLIDTAVTLAGYVLGTFATDAQRARFLPLVERGAIEMCIAYTEELAGSDLGAQVTSAIADRDAGFVLSGRKVLVTGAHKADWCVTTARTRPDVAVRDGLSMFLVDMTLPGVTVVRRPTMNGWTLDEITFDDVRLASDALLGEQDAGWRQLLTTVAAERSGMFYLGFARHVLDELIEYVSTTSRDGRRLADDPLVRDRVARLDLELAAGVRLATRTLWGIESGGPDPALPPMAKVYATELLQRLAQAATEVAGHAGLVHAPLFTEAVPPQAAAGGRFAWEYLERVHGTIGGGTNEVQRDAIAQLGLGLPRTRR